MPRQTRRVVITGTGTVTPFGLGTGALVVLGVLLLLVLGINILLASYERAEGRRLGSPLLKADAAHTSGGQIEQQRRTQTTRAHAQHGRCLEALLPLHAHLGQDQVPGKTGHLIGAELNAAGIGRKHGRWDQLSIVHGRRCGRAGGSRIHQPSSGRAWSTP